MKIQQRKPKATFVQSVVMVVLHSMKIRDVGNVMYAIFLISHIQGIKMLTELILHNFRSHLHTVIKLVKGVNMIIGKGQAGKTNIKRGVEWLHSNRPLKGKVHSWWCREKEDETYVQATTSEGTTVRIRKKVGGSVGYTLTWADGSIENFDTVGTKVPDKVKLALNLGELNLQGQMDLPYLVTKGTSEISRAVNAVVDLELESAGWHNATTLTKLNEQHTAKLSGLKAYSRLSEAEGALVGAETLQTKLYAAQRKEQGLRTAMNTVIEANAEAVALAPGLEAKAILEEAEAVLASITTKKAFLVNYQYLTAQDWDLEQQRTKHIEISTAYIELLEEMGVCPICYTEVTQATMSKITKELRPLTRRVLS